VSAEPLRSITDFLESFIAIGTFGDANTAVEVAAVLIPPNTTAFISAEFLRFHFRFLNYNLPAVLTMILVGLGWERLPRLDIVPPTIGFHGAFPHSDFCGDFCEFRSLLTHFYYGLLLNISHVHHLIIYEYAR